MWYLQISPTVFLNPTTAGIFNRKFVLSCNRNLPQHLLTDFHGGVDDFDDDDDYGQDHPSSSALVSAGVKANPCSFFHYLWPLEMIRMARRVMVLMTWLNMISIILKWFKPKQNIIQNSAQGVVAIMFCICALLGSPFWCWRTVVDVGDNDEDDHHLLYSCSVIFVFELPPFLSATISAGIVCLCHGESLQRQKGFELGLGVRNNQLHPQRKLNRSLLVTELPFFWGLWQSLIIRVFIASVSVFNCSDVKIK